MVENPSSLQTMKSAVQHTSEGESAAKRALLRNDVAGEVLKVIPG